MPPRYRITPVTGTAATTQAACGGTGHRFTFIVPAAEQTRPASLMDDAGRLHRQSRSRAWDSRPGSGAALRRRAEPVTFVLASSPSTTSSAG